MDSLASCGMKFIILINTFFGMLAIGLIVLGLLLIYAHSLINPLVSSIVNAWRDDLEPILTVSHIDVDNFLTKFDLGAFLGKLGVPLIVIGVVLAVVVVIGYSGAGFKSHTILIVYSTILCLILAAQITGMVLIFCYRDVVDTELKPATKSTLVSYEGDKGLNAVSVIWNTIMIKFHCCGVSDYTDFAMKAKWRNVTLSDHHLTLTAPIACCDEDALNITINNVPVCALDPITYFNTSYALQGCYEPVLDELQRYKGYVIGTVTTSIVFQFVLLFLASWMAKELRHELQVEPEKQ